MDDTKKGKGGRPRKREAELRRHNVTVALTDDELARLQAAADQYKQPLNVMVRKLALDRKLPNPPTPQVDRDTYITLTKTGNQIAGLCKKGKTKETVEWLKKLKSDIDGLRRQLLIGGSDDSKYK